MTSNIEDLFGQIVSSERKARKRKSLINEVKKNINLWDVSIADRSEDVQKLKGQLAVKVQLYNDLKLQVNWSRNQQNVLTSQRQELQQSCDSLTDCKDEVERKVEETHTQFMTDVRRFCNVYDLISNGEERRAAEWVVEIDKLQHKMKQLQLDLLKHKKLQSDLEIVRTKKTERKSQLEGCSHNLQELKDQLEREKAELVTCQSEHNIVAKAPHLDPDFLKLQMELKKEASKSGHFENLCASLEHDLQSHQQQQWQKQLQQRQQMKQTTGLITRPDMSQISPTLVPPSASAVMATNYTHANNAAGTSMATTPVSIATSDALQPWADDDDVFEGAVVPDEVRSEHLKRPLNLTKLTTAINQQKLQSRFTFKSRNPDTTNHSLEDAMANGYAASATNQSGEEDLISRKRLLWEQEQHRQQQVYRKNIIRQ